MPPYSYKAFLSYSHSADGRLAPGLQSALQTFAKPWNRMRIFKIFRDKTSLSANPALWGSIQDALADSEFLLLMASPLSAKSRWVEREVAWWLANRSISKLLILLTDGEMVWDATGNDYDWNTTTALSPNLRGRFHEEPLYVDLRWARSGQNLTLRHAPYRDAVLDIAAPLNGKPKDELDSEEIRQYRKTRGIRNAGIAALIGLTGIASYAAWIATRQSRLAEQRRQEAERQRRIAEERLEQARRSLYALQIARVANTGRADSTGAIRMLVDLARCPLDLREFTWGYYKRLFGSQDASPRVFDGLKTAIRTIAFSPDGITAAIPAPNGIWLLDLGSGEARVIESPGGSVLSVAISPDGALLAAVTDSYVKCELWLWDLGTDQARSLMEGSLSAARFSPDGKSLALAGHGEVLLWNLEKAEARTLLKGLRGAVRVIAFSPDGRLLASGGWDNTVHVVDLDPGTERFALKGHTATVIGVVFSADGNTLTSVSEKDRVLAVPNSFLGYQKPEVISWDLRSGTHRLVIQSEDDVPIITALALSPDGRTLATGHRNGSVEMWDPHTFERLGRLHTAALPILALDYLPDGKRLAAGAGIVGSIPNSGQPGALYVWEAEDWDQCAILRGHKGQIHSLAFAEGGALVSAAGYDGGEVMAPGEAILWDTVTGQSRLLLSQHDNAAYAGRFFPDAKRIAVATRRGLHLLERETGADRLLRTVNSAMFAWLDVSPDGKLVCLAEERGPVVLLDANTGTQVASVDGRGPVAFSPDGKVLATAFPDGQSAMLWDVPAHTQRQLLPGQFGSVTCLAFSPDGSVLATGSADHSVKLWNRTSGRELSTFTGHTDAVQAVAFAPGGKLLVTGAGSSRWAPGEFRLWNVTTGSLIRSVPEPGGPVLAVAFSPDGKLLATSGRDKKERSRPGEVRLWQVAGLTEPLR